MDFRENSERHSAQETDDPQRGNDADGSLQARHRVQMEWVANRQKALHREGDDREHRDVSGSGGMRRRVDYQSPEMLVMSYSRLRY
jgi:hypothetical protein